MGEYEQAVVNVLKKYGVYKEHIPYSFDVNFFNQIDSQEKAYLLGFIAADGCLQDNGAGSLVLSITIHKQDISVLEYMKKSIRADQPIIHLKRDNMVRINFTRKKFASDLMKHGICQRKSLILPDILSSIPQNMKSHLIRGFFDGNGSISWSKTGSKELRPYVSFRGSQDFLKSIRSHLGIRGSFGLSNGTYYWRFGAINDVISFEKYIYDDADFYLKRKYDKFPSNK